MGRSRSKNKGRRARRKFTPEFKADVVRLCRTGSETIGEVCRRLDLTELSSDTMSEGGFVRFDQVL